MKRILLLTLVAGFGLISACKTIPKELIDAREAYDRASSGPAVENAPTELLEAQDSLNQAEDSYQKRPSSYRTRDLAYVAQRKAQIAEARAAAVSAQKKTAKAKKDYVETQNEVIQKTKQELTAAQLELAKLAAVKQEARGLVITLSGSVLFASAKSELLPTSQARLSQVSDALMQSKDSQLIIEGHTDSQGTAAYNLDLSQRRADAVRSFLISRGYPSELIEARGIGEDRPVASNASPEGRANNRRVEIIVVPEANQ